MSRTRRLSVFALIVALSGLRPAGAEAAGPVVSQDRAGHKAGEPHELGLAVDGISKPTVFVRGVDGRLGSGVASGPPILAAAAHRGTGYFLVDVNGSMSTWGSASFLGDLSDREFHGVVVAMAVTSGGDGYWLATSAGEIYGFGSVASPGLTPVDYSGQLGDDDILVGIASVPGTNGFLAVSAGGRVFAKGTEHLGDWAMPGITRPATAVAGIAVNQAGLGYWLYDEAGRVGAFGDAEFRGDMSAHAVAVPIVGLSPVYPQGGYMLVGADGGIFNFSSAPFQGSAGAYELPAPILRVATHPDGGYWMFGVDGHVYPFGAAQNYGSPWSWARVTFTSFEVGTTRVEVYASSLPDGMPLATLDQTWSPADGYLMLDRAGNVHAFGGAVAYDAFSGMGGKVAVDLEPTWMYDGYWILDEAGGVHGRGNAPRHGSLPAGTLSPGERATSLAGTPGDGGYWIFTSRGRVFPFGDAEFLGDMSAVTLNGPVLDSVATPTGAGYYMVASDGGIFTFGDAKFHGSMGQTRLNAPVESLVPDGDGMGYWLVASDGGIFAFEAPYRGSMGGTRLNGPVTGMVRFGDGYLMVGTDGGIFNFSGREFYGSLGASPPPDPIVAVAAVDPFGW